MTAPSLSPERWKSEEGEQDRDGGRQYKKEKREREKGRRVGDVCHICKRSWETSPGIVADETKLCPLCCSLLWRKSGDQQECQPLLGSSWLWQESNWCWLAHASWFSDNSQWKPIYQKSPVPMQHSKTPAAVKHSKLSDVSCAINHSLMDAPY